MLARMTPMNLDRRKSTSHVNVFHLNIELCQDPAFPIADIEHVGLRPHHVQAST